MLDTSISSAAPLNDVQAGAQNCKIDLTKLLCNRKLKPAELTLQIADEFSKELDIEDQHQYGYLLAIAEYIVLNHRISFKSSDWHPLNIVSKLPEMQSLNAFLYKQGKKRAAINAIKPHHSSFLKATVRKVNLDERAEQSSNLPEVYQFGDYVFDKQIRSVFFKGNTVKFTSKEFNLALLFFKNLNQTLSIKQIHESVWWAKEVGISRTLNTHICKIKTRLALCGEGGYKLVSVYKHGYRLEATEEHL